MQRTGHLSGLRIEIPNKQPTYDNSDILGDKNKQKKPIFENTKYANSHKMYAQHCIHRHSASIPVLESFSLQSDSQLNSFYLYTTLYFCLRSKPNVATLTVALPCSEMTKYVLWWQVMNCKCPYARPAIHKGYY